MRTLKALSFTVLGVATAALAFTAGRPAPPDTHPDQPPTDVQQIGETWNARIAQMDDLLHSSQALVDRARELDRTLAPMARRDAGELDRNVDLLEQMSENVAAMAENLNETGQRYESMLRDPGVRTAPAWPRTWTSSGNMRSPWPPTWTGPCRPWSPSRPTFGSPSRRRGSWSTDRLIETRQLREEGGGSGRRPRPGFAALPVLPVAGYFEAGVLPDGAFLRAVFFPADFFADVFFAAFFTAFFLPGFPARSACPDRHRAASGS